MKLSELTERISLKLLSGSIDTEISGISRDNRKAESGDLFICTKGARFDTHDASVIAQLIGIGIKAFITERDVLSENEELGKLIRSSETTVLLAENTRSAGACVYAAWNGHPAERMTTVGITGSKGKTTVTHVLAAILTAGGHKVGTIGTNGAIFNGETRELKNTTPESDEIQTYLRQMADAGCDTAVIEVSSQGMKQHRADGFVFDYGIWMNIQTGDHIGPNEHESFEDYLFCKAELLNHSRLGFIHADDPYFGQLLPLVHVPYETFGTSDGLDYIVRDIRKVFDEEKEVPGIAFTLDGKLQGGAMINLPGDFNAVNALAALAAADHMGVSLEDAKRALSDIHIKGRTDIVFKGEDFSVCVDFAHNGASTFHHLEALREFRPKRLVCVFGADGNRSKGRRYGMGEAAGKLADFSIVTSGHNRYETFEAILSDTEVGLHKAPHPNYIAIKDRKEAIRYAVTHAEKGDLITVIGLGHETWQEENGVKYPHSDTEYVLDLVRELGLKDIREERKEI